MKKCLISLALSAVSLFSATAMTANAVSYPAYQIGSDDYNKAIEGYKFFKYYPDEGVYPYYGNSGYQDEFLEFRSRGKFLDVLLSPETDKDELNEIMNRLAPDIKYSIYDKNPSYIDLSVCDYEARPETEGIIKQLKTEFTEKFDVQKFDYYGHIYDYKPLVQWYDGYAENRLYFKYTDETEAELKAAIEETGVDAVLKFDDFVNTCIIDKDYQLFYIVPTHEMKLEEFFENALPLHEKFEWSPAGCTNTSTKGVSEIDVVDVLTAIDGDSNADGALTIADAALILQHIGNPDKYKLSAQGKFNADVVGNGDGISALDALAIQQYEAGVIDSLG